MAATEPRDNLIQGIVAKWAASVTLASLPLRQGQRSTGTTANPASGTQFPYAIIPTGDRSFCFARSCGNDYWRHPVRFRIYHTSLANCAAQVKLVNDIFRPRSLTLTLPAGDLVKSVCQDATYRQESSETWYAEVSYEFETSFAVQA